MSKMNRAGSGSGVPPCGTPGTPKPVPMKLFATWEVDRTPSNCIPRLCSLTLTRLVVLRPLGSDLASISIAVKMQSNKRTLRSNELMLPPSGLLDTSLEMTFSLQYPHFLKRDGNRLHVLLQRRKRYKNRTMLGFKTLAEGFIRMDQVLQKPMDLELELVAEGGSKEKSTGMQTVAKLTVIQISSTPVDQEQKSSTSILADRGFSDEEEEAEFTSGEEEGQDMSDSEPIRSKLPHTRHNLKQRFVSLLRRFRAADTEGNRAALGATSDIQALFNELDSLSCDEDSGGEQDTMSISSTPKPSLRPFFSSSRSLLDSQVTNDTLVNTQQNDDRNLSGSDGNPDVCWTDYEAQSDPQTGSPPREKDKENIDRDRKSRLFRTAQSASTGKKKHSICSGGEKNTIEIVAGSPSDNSAPRKSFLNALSRALPTEDITLPETIALIDSIVSSSLIQKIEQNASLSNIRILQPIAPSECRTILQNLINKIHKFCNSCAKTPSSIRVLIIGGDTLTSACLRNYVDLLSGQPPEWQNYIRFYIVPIGSNSISRQLSMLDSGYAALFPFEGVGGSGERSTEDLITRIQRYILTPSPFITHLPLAEAMLTCHDESSQIFIPFVAEVRIGSADNPLSMSVEMEDTVGNNVITTSNISGVSSSVGSTLTSSSPPAPLTPPSSPNVQVRELVWEPLELQLDFWQVLKNNDSNKIRTEGKNSLKGAFRSVHVSRIPGSSQLSLTVYYATKEKKQKIMRLGKKKEKDKETETKNQTIDGITRLICSTSKTSHNPSIRVYIDGAEWTGVKFFQLSSTWQTHVKMFSAALIGNSISSTELN